MQTVEQFRDYSITPVTLGWIHGFGVKHELQVDPELRERFVWIAAGCYAQDVAGDVWWFTCRVNFLLGGNLRGSLIYQNYCEPFTVPGPTFPNRELLRPVNGCDGSPQPVLRYEANASIAAGYKRYLEIPCFRVVVECDRVSFEIERCDGWATGLNPTRYLTGLRIQSNEL